MPLTRQMRRRAERTRSAIPANGYLPPKSVRRNEGCTTDCKGQPHKNAGEIARRVRQADRALAARSAMGEV